MRWGRWWASRSERADFELVVAELDDRAVLDGFPAGIVVVRLRRDDDASGELAIVEHEERVAPRGGRDALPVGQEGVEARRRVLFYHPDAGDKRVGGGGYAVVTARHRAQS